jgi:hypothetical protein
VGVFGHYYLFELMSGHNIEEGAVITVAASGMLNIACEWAYNEAMVARESGQIPHGHLNSFGIQFRVPPIQYRGCRSMI